MSLKAYILMLDCTWRCLSALSFSDDLFLSYLVTLQLHGLYSIEYMKKVNHELER
jgi:hypothetical protein